MGEREPVSVGDVIAGKYRVERVIGKGGMGMVVVATHLELRKRRAIKLMLASATPRAAERFLREARAACLLENEHIAHVFDVGRLPTGEPFIVMEYLEGNDLADELARRGRLPLEEVVESALQVCLGLAEAHGRTLIHRDLKPGNLFLAWQSDGSRRLKVLDFGISKRLDDSAAPATTTGAVIGTPLYMSPEQIQASKAVDGRSDIWSLGVVLYELATGQRPFQADTLMGAIARIATYRPRPPSHYAPELPAAFDAVVLRCLEKKPEHRYADVAALARDLLPFAPPGASALGQRVERVLSISSSLPPEPPSSKATPELYAEELAVAATMPARREPEPAGDRTAPMGSPASTLSLVGGLVDTAEGRPTPTPEPPAPDPLPAPAPEAKEPAEPARSGARDAAAPTHKGGRGALFALAAGLLGLGAGIVAMVILAPGAIKEGGSLSASSAALPALESAPPASSGLSFPDSSASPAAPSTTVVGSPNSAAPLSMPAPPATASAASSTHVTPPPRATRAPPAASPAGIGKPPPPLSVPPPPPSEPPPPLPEPPPRH